MRRTAVKAGATETLHSALADLDDWRFAPRRAAAVIQWVLEPVRLLNDLSAAATRVLDGDVTASDDLIRMLDHHGTSHGWQHGQGDRNARTHAAHGMSSRFGPGPARPRPGCDFTDIGVVGGVGLALVVATPHDLGRRDALLDELSSAVTCLGAAESLYAAAVSGDRERLAWRIRMVERDPRFAEIAALTAQAAAGRRQSIAGDWPDDHGPRDLPAPNGPGEGPFPFPRSPDDGRFPVPAGPDDGPAIPLPCPPPMPGDCDFLREYCLGEVLDRLRRPRRMPDGSHVHADGITGVTADACSGDVVTISGTGFGTTQPADVDVLMRVETDHGTECAAVEVRSWSDTEIQVRTPPDAAVGCVGFLDRSVLEEQQELAHRANVELQELNDALACLKGAPLPTHIPMPSDSDCPPCTDVNRVEAGDPRILGFRAEARAGATTADGGWSGTTTVSVGQRLRLLWTVENADSIGLRRTSALGPDFAGTNSVTDPPGSAYDLGITSHPEPQQWTYELTASNRCGTVSADVTVVATADPRLAFGNVEVTQGIQDTAGGVRLVADKRTVVRVFLSHGLGTFDGGVVPAVTGTVTVRRADGSVLGTLHPINGTSPPSAVAGTTIDVPSAPQRANVGDSLNFLIPAGWSRGTRRLSLHVWVDDYGAPASLPGTGRTEHLRQGLGTYTFTPRHPIAVEYLRVRWRGSDGTLRTPSAANCEATLRRAMQRIAAPVGAITEHPDSPLRPGDTHDDDRMEDLLDDWDDRHRCEITEAIFASAGIPVPAWICFDFPQPGILDDVGEAFWALMPGSFYRGRAADIPAATTATPARTATDTGWTANRLDTKAAHELSHCLDQEHLNRCGAGGGDAQSDWPNNGTLADVAFDIEQNTTVNGAVDLMTYCNPRWTMPARWDAVFGYVGG